MIEAARISETSVDNYFTRYYIPENKSELHTRRHENLKSHTVIKKFITPKPVVCIDGKYIIQLFMADAVSWKFCTHDFIVVFDGTLA
jgi:hypothetical protein